MTPRTESSLSELAYNLRWAWEPKAAQLFAALAPHVWRATHNPVAVARYVADSRDVDQFATDIEAARCELEHYLDAAGAQIPPIAYLCAEFAITECLPIYAGGLGVLAGDHLKAASDLGLPVIGVGLFYRFGYFHQSLDSNGRQLECYEALDPRALPLRLVTWPDGTPLGVAIPLGVRTVCARVWRADVGRVPLYLLDTDLAQNRDDDRWITAHAYGGDQDTRLRQEIVLGIGGARLLRLLGAAGLEPLPGVYHLNEGHSALVVLELARGELQRGGARNFDEALELVAQRTVFTTHTPVAAGHDTFSSALIDMYLGQYGGQLGLTTADLLRLARVHPDDPNESFSMTALALRGAARRNGVSQLHGFISRQMWSGVGVGASGATPTVEMRSITNGIHGPTWAGPEMRELFEYWLGPRWRTHAREPATWAPLTDVPMGTLWAARTAQRERLLTHAGLAFDAPSTLIIGFARRFASYKRAGLLLEEADRLAGLLQRSGCVVIFAGKAHPHDEPAKRLVQHVVHASHQERFAGRLVFLEDYDVKLARLMVQGCDVWLNTPRRPHEASGTSGMKAVLNGALHLSERDGWWDEAYRSDVGWALDEGIAADLPEPARDAAEAARLLHLLEHDVVPLFFQREASGVPVAWLQRVVRSIMALAPVYSAERMVLDYAEQMYLPAAGDRVGHVVLAQDRRTLS